MFPKHVSILLATGVLLLGIAGMAQAEDKGKTIRSQEQVRITEQHKAQVKTGDPVENGAGNQIMTQERTRAKDGTGDHELDQDRDRDRLRDGTGDHDPDRLRDQDRIHDHLGSGAGGMGGGMRGPQR